MKKTTLRLACAALLLTAAGCGHSARQCTPGERDSSLASIDSMSQRLDWPKDLSITAFAGPRLTPSPACLAVAATGEVYVGVDMIGSLGKTPGRGRIVRLVDCNHDGILDSHTDYAEVNNPRGIISMGDKLYVLHTRFSDSAAADMELVVFQDADHDGVADGAPTTLVKHMSNPSYLKSRGTDHATNGIRMGIDGWIYIAVGDFGFHDAVGSDGTTLTMLGGGIVRVRPDGSEMEIYTHGTRNIYDVAIDPYMNIFTRDNTNDGGGWNIRFSHQVQSGEYGYPVLWRHFTEEIIPALVDLGGGSGTGALFMDEPSWPDSINHVPMMCDWGRSEVYIHRLTAVGGSFTQQQQAFIKLPQVTDLDVDGSGALYISAWDGAGYSGDSAKGFVVRAVPKGWSYHPFPDLKKASVAELGALLKSPGAVARLAAQQELLSRDGGEVSKAAWEIASDKSIPLYARVAGIYTYAQAAGAGAVKDLTTLAGEEAVREFALRALADRKSFVKEVPMEPFIKALKDTSDRVRIAAAVGLGRLGRPEAAQALLEVPVPASFVSPPQGQDGPHATPNPGIIPAHVAVHALVALDAVDACLAAVGTDHSTLALWALRYMHDPRAVDGLIAAYDKATDPALKTSILTTLARLYHQEAPYDGTWWWGTRPDTHGPYYKPVEWQSSDTIRALLVREWEHATPTGKKYFAALNGRLSLGITRFGGEEVPAAATEDVKVDLNKIKSRKGQIGNSSIEDIMLAMDKIKGNPGEGRVLFTRQGCIACHTLDKSQPPKGPFMGQIGSIMNRKQIAESILKPNASISQGFATVRIKTTDGKTHTGFVTAQSADRVVLRDISGTPHVIPTKQIASREELKTSIMPTGLANALSYEEFASLITFLSAQK